jgi:hypothetical protein
MAKYKTALGKVLDMSGLIAKNERTRAVGNMKVNARGDTIDAKGNIVKKVTEKVTENYGKTVGSRSARPVNRPSRPADSNPRTTRQQPKSNKGVNQRIPDTELTDSERELENDFNDDLEVERIKARDNNNGR